MTSFPELGSLLPFYMHYYTVVMVAHYRNLVFTDKTSVNKSATIYMHFTHHLMSILQLRFLTDIKIDHQLDC